MAQNEWSGSCCPIDPDGCWVDDVTEEHVDAATGHRTPEHPGGYECQECGMDDHATSECPNVEEADPLDF